MASSIASLALAGLDLLAERVGLGLLVGRDLLGGRLQVEALAEAVAAGVADALELLGRRLDRLLEEVTAELLDLLVLDVAVLARGEGVLHLLAGLQRALDLLLDPQRLLLVAELALALLVLLARGLLRALEVGLLLLGVAVLLLAAVLHHEVLEALDEGLLLGRGALDGLVVDRRAVVAAATAGVGGEAESEGRQARGEDHAVRRLHGNFRGVLCVG